MYLINLLIENTIKNVKFLPNFQTMGGFKLLVFSRSDFVVCFMYCTVATNFHCHYATVPWNF